MSEKTLTINEIYQSIQGESTWAGQRCAFVRLTFCNLRCNYCDTEYAFYEGKKQTLKEIVDLVAAFHCPLVEITGGEPVFEISHAEARDRRHENKNLTHHDKKDGEDQKTGGQALQQHGGPWSQPNRARKRTSRRVRAENKLGV